MTYLPLLPSQTEIWTAQRIDPANPRYFCGSYYALDRALDAGGFTEAARIVFGEFEALRTRFVTTQDEPSQIVGPPVDWAPEVLDLSGRADPMASAEAWMQDDLSRVRPLEDGHLFRLALICVGPAKSLLYVRYHHLQIDGLGQALVLQRLAEVYNAAEAGRSPTPGVNVPLSELIEENQAYEASASYGRDRDYWCQALGDAPAPVHLADRSILPSRQRLRRTACLAANLADDLRSQGKDLGVPWSSILVAAWAVYLHKYTHASTIIVSLPLPGRRSPGALSTPAMLANEVPLRLEVEADEAFGALVRQATTAIAQALKAQRFRGDEISRALGREDRLQGPVINVVAFERPTAFGQSEAVATHLSSGPVRDLSIDIHAPAAGRDVTIHFDANPAAYRASDLAAHQERFLQLLSDIAAHGPQRAVAELEVVTATERERLVHGLNATSQPYDLTEPLHAHIARTCEHHPDRVAVSFADQSLTYRELWTSACTLAHHLVLRGVEVGDRIGLYESRGLDLIVDALAALMVGATYVPLDPEAPASRTQLQLDDAGIRLVLSSGEHAPAISALGIEVVDVGRARQDLPVASTPPAVVVSPEAVAYVIYTSGSTGVPKGVRVPHRGVVNRLLWMQLTYDLTEDDRVLQKTPTTFDVSVWELFWPLIAGAQLVLLEPGAHRDPRAVARACAKASITTLHFVPPMLDLFLAEPLAAAATSIRQVFCSGEALPSSSVRRFFEVFPSGVELHNLYGPTEASIDVTHWRCRPEDALRPIPIGRGVANTQLFVLDDRGHLVPFGATGELFIGGTQVALGYLNRPELTAERFVANPFGPGRLYRTGDLVRYRDDGALDFIGRADSQFKIRGFRVEPDEIQVALCGHRGVAQAFVAPWSRTASDRRLVAYLVAGGERPSDEQLTRWVASRLPEYMVPAHFVWMDELPLLSNGKIDRRALPEPLPAEPVAILAPQTPEEVLLHAAWSEVLGHDRFGVDDSFFALGGDSISTVRLRAAAERRGKTFEVEALFSHPTIRQLAPTLRRHDVDASAHRAAVPFSMLASADRARLPEDAEDAFGLTRMQAGMLFHAEEADDSAIYRVVTSLLLHGPRDRETLHRAIQDTARRHPLMRASFHLTGYSEPLQIVHREVEVPVVQGEDLSVRSPADQWSYLQAWIQREKARTFDLTTAPLLIFYVHPRGQDRFQLTVVEHHVALDGWSDALMLDEIVRRYRAALAGQTLWLPEVPSTYQAFVRAEREALADPKAREFWQDELVGATATALPKQSGGSGAARMMALPVPISGSVQERLTRISQEHDLSLKSILAAVHLAVLRFVGTSAEVVTGLVSHGRLAEDGGDEVVGVFLNTLPIRLDVQGSFLDLARAVFGFEARSAPYRRYPYGQIQRDLPQPFELESYVNFMDFHSSWNDADQDGVAVRDSYGVAETNYPLAANFLVDPHTNRLELWLDCNAALLSEQLCGRLAHYYAKAIEAVAARPQAPVEALDLLSEAEREVVEAWTRTQGDFDEDATMHSLIEAQADRTPEAIALIDGEGQLRYEDLDRRANQLAHHLTQQGVKPGDRVGVSLARGTDLVVSLLAVIKAGAAYVPLDPGFPSTRIAFIVSDAALSALITTSEDRPRDVGEVPVVELDRSADQIRGMPDSRPRITVASDSAAYVIYTSGSTGRPKGTKLMHRNAVNFFAAMTERLGGSASDVMLSVTSVSFDISILELFWPLTFGAQVVVAPERLIENLVPDPVAPQAALDLGLFFFAASTGDAERKEGYRLVREAARFADRAGFSAIWTPERHFHEFGGLYPNPSVMSAALSSITERVQLRCGSVVSPLHDTIRLAEEWSLVDNLSNGRVGLAFASGWNPNDFALAPDDYSDRKAKMVEQLAEFRKLWKGDAVRRVNGRGEAIDVRIFPSPVQAEPPLWLTSAGSPATFELAGTLGLNVLTHLLGQDIAEVTAKIDAYRAAWDAAGHPGRGRVSLMIHTFILDDGDEARRIAKGPFKEYLRSSTGLLKELASSMGLDLPTDLVDDDLEAVLDLAVDRYFDRSGLFGSPDTAAHLLRELAPAGIDELACLIDFGVPPDDVLRGLESLQRLLVRHRREARNLRHSLTELIDRHAVTMMQGTPSFMAAVAADRVALQSLSKLGLLLVGGEAFPMGLADRLFDNLPQTRIFNMYGPTETTIWSTVYELQRATDAKHGSISIGRPILNTDVVVLDDAGRLLPPGFEGELWIGGAGVAAEYLGRPDLTEERFRKLPGREGRFYRTGDRVRWREDGNLEFRGRLDRQVKILGHRIELDEVENTLSRHEQVSEVAVVAHERDNGAAELVAFVSSQTTSVASAVKQAHVKQWGSAWNSAYEGTAGSTADFDGWLSSYTAEPIPQDHMQSWLDSGLARIRSLQPKRVVDLGVGVGLFLRGLVTGVEHYVGIDLSKNALARSAEAARQVGADLDRVQLLEGDAGILETIEAGAADLFLINSVAQYFPDLDYLAKVLDEAARIVGPQGRIFIGDVRDLRLLRTFHTSVRQFRAGPLDLAKDLRAEVERALSQEKELCIAPDYFTDRFGARAEVTIRPKGSLHSNELSDFRFDVLIDFGRAGDWPASEREIEWGARGADARAQLLALLEERTADRIVGIPNRRLLQHSARDDLLAGVSDETTSWEIDRYLWQLNPEATLDPEAAVELATARGFEAIAIYGSGPQPGTFDLRIRTPQPERRHPEGSRVS